MQSHQALLRVDNLHKTYRLGERRVRALRGISLEIMPGSFCAIVGPSGSGKSTLLNIIGLLDRPDEGTIRLGKTDAGKLGPAAAARARREQIGFIFQDFSLIPVLNAYENVELPLRLAGGGRSRGAIREWVMHLLEGVGLDDHARHKPAQLSGGQQQRVAIARALVNRPSLVLADEPTANLDSQTGQAILELMHRFNRDLGTAFLFSTHDAAIRAIAETTFPLRDGAIVE
ncbi:MAG: ABC transporter ATP-binding protein [Spirochaetota bacterium]